jgi:hypothetical protein
LNGKKGGVNFFFFHFLINFQGLEGKGKSEGANIVGAGGYITFFDIIFKIFLAVMFQIFFDRYY